MSNFARWEQEARQPLGPLQPDIPQPDPGSIPQQTVEVDMIELLAQEPETARPAPSTAEHEIAEIHALLAAEEEAAHDADDPAQDDAAAYDEDDPAAYDEDDVSEEASADRAVATRERLTEAGRSLAGTGRSFGRWVASLDRRPEFSLHHERDPLAQLGSGTPDAPADEPSGETPSFAVAPLGYNRQAVDEHVARLEAELGELRALRDRAAPPISITEEIERIGEETASILVVAHDRAHETARRAQEQAERRVRDADTRAERVIADAERRLRELDEETDAVWRERERLLQDVRVVCTSLTALADDADERFPADPVAMAGVRDAEADAPVAADPSAMAESTI